MAATTDTKNDSTNVFIDFPDGDQVKLDGREARTMYRLLSKHYASTGKSQF
jgi:argininosuccinate synthase